LAKAKRVFEVAKELGVDSKAIVEKCLAEGVPDIKNHMSTVKVGLYVTIKEWFSAAESSTAIEQAEKVDIEKVRRPARRKAKASSKASSPSSAESDADGGVAVATEDAVSDTVADAAADTGSGTGSATGSDTIQSGAPVETSAEAAARSARKRKSAAGAENAQAADQADAVADADQASGQAAGAGSGTGSGTGSKADGKALRGPGAPVVPAGRPNVPDRPQVVKPAGEQLAKPRSAELRGPRVVRIEKPDAVAPPRSRRVGGGPGGPAGGGGGGGVAGGGADSGVTRSRGPARGRGVGSRDDESSPQRAASKRRSLTSRRGRSTDLPTGPTQFSEQDLAELDARLRGASGFLKQRRRDMRKKDHQGPMASAAAVTGGKVEIAEPIFIKDLSSATGIKAADIIKYLFKKGVMSTINSAIDAEAAMEIALEYDIELVVREQQTAEQMMIQEFDRRETLDERGRPPVVTVLGHVDHGKTSLLDRIRKADVAEHEDGGITQHIGAYRVQFEKGGEERRTVVFLDTPGHEAFTQMRARGANMTDLVVLVVAADDGVMPQTVESINHAKAAGVPLVVALNKIDKQEATSDNLHRIYGQLSEHGLNPVEWGGDTEIVKTSAETGQGVDELLEMLDYQAELLELKADYGGRARGSVIEAEMQEGRGPVARVLVQEGQIKVGDFLVAGRAYGRVRDMTDDRGRALRDAGPSTPLEISGIDMVPDAGDMLYVTETLQQAESIALQYRDVERHKQLASKTKVTLANFADQIKAGGVQELRLVLKADVQGSIEVIRDSVHKLSTDEVKVRILHSGVGGVNESDVLLAEASDAVVVGFHVVASQHARDLAEQRGVDVRLYRVIYDLVDEVKASMEGLLAPETREIRVGQAEVREVFRVSKIGFIAGCLVTEGVVRRGAKMRVVRDDVVVTDERSIESLRRVKDDVREVRAGTECGIRLAGFDDVKAGDKLVCYDVEKIKRTL
jgi:translation initiation factor IF-2